jgi:hypothetical protein
VGYVVGENHIIPLLGSRLKLSELLEVQILRKNMSYSQFSLPTIVKAFNLTIYDRHNLAIFKIKG